MTDNSPGGLEPAGTTEVFFLVVIKRVVQWTAGLSLRSSDDPLCCRVQLSEVFHVGFPVQASLIYKREIKRMMMSLLQR